MQAWLVTWSKSQQIIPLPDDASDAVIVIEESADRAIRKALSYVKDKHSILDISAQPFLGVKIIDARGDIKTIQDQQNGENMF